MSKHNARALVNRQLRVLSSGVRTDRKPQQLVCEANPYKATLRHIKATTRLATRANVAMEEEGDRMSRAAKAIIEQYESYALRKKYCGEKAYTIGEYIRQYHRKGSNLTYNIRSEIKAWYDAHGTERIARMRKMHAIVGTTNRPILRTE